jgi:polysaccharide export outer membrane protein
MRGLIRSAIRGLLPALVLAGCSVAPSTTEKVQVEVEVLNALTRYELVYVLQAGDQVEVFVYRQPDFSRKATVRADGFISLPLLGDVRAAGKSPTELGRELKALFAVRLRDPEVTVIVENPPEPVVYVVGEVGTPKSVPLRQARTAAQAIAQSGALTRGAELFSVSVIRLGKDGYLEAHNVTTQGYSQPEAYMALQNLALRPNDLVVVPESYRSQIVRAFSDVNTLLLPYFQYRVLEDLVQ